MKLFNVIVKRVVLRSVIVAAKSKKEAEKYIMDENDWDVIDWEPGPKVIAKTSQITKHNYDIGSDERISCPWGSKKSLNDGLDNRTIEEHLLGVK